MQQLFHETVFQSTKLEYQEALRKSDYKSTLKYKPKNNQGKKRTRRKKHEMVQSMSTLALLRVIGSSATKITPCHSEIKDTKNDTAFSSFFIGA